MDEESGLESLIAQRKSRPAFARMISWEIDNSGSVSRRRPRGTSTASTEDGSHSEDEQEGENSEDSEGSEYYSAEEDMSGSSDDSGDSQSNYTSADLQSNTTEDTNTSLTTDDTESTFDSLDISSSQSDIKRGLSKKQKKKRRDRLKNTALNAYADYDVPFRNVEDIDIEVSDLVGFTDDLSRSCTRKIPTLFELCVQAVSNKRPKIHRQSTSDLPRIVKHVLHDKRRDQSFTSVQLSWLYRLMAIGEKNLYDKFVTKDSKGIAKLKLNSRNIWNSCFLGNGDSNLEYIGSSLSSILRYSYIYFEYQYYEADNWRYRFSLLSVVASVVDLMLPQQLSTGRLRHASRDCSTESELIKKTTDGIVYSVKNMLKQRYPGVVQYFFDEAVPYVFWARGNLKFAAECFVRLAQAKEGTERAVLLSEAARLYAQNEEMDKASRLYMESSGAVITRAANLQQDHDVTLQQFMLMASVYDQGVMTAEKAQKAAEAWAAALKYFDPRCPWSSATRAVESFLCFHGGSTDNMKDCLQRADSLIEKQCKNCDVLLLYLSLVRALLGDARQSYQAYRAFLSSATAAVIEVPELPRERGSRRFTPWQPLIDHFAVHGSPVILKVVWRTQLGHLRVVNDQNVFEADMLIKSNLNLRLMETGYLTADLQMLLPPIRALCLDPYTGLHVHTSGLTEDWHSLSILPAYRLHSMNGYFLVPTLVELCRDEVGNRVHILSPDDGLIGTDHMSRQVTLFWTGRNGQRAKLNLIPYLKDAIKEFTLDEINKVCEVYPNAPNNGRGSSAWADNMRLTTDFCHKKGFALGFHNVENVKSRLWNLVLKSCQPAEKVKKCQMTKKQRQEKKKEEKKKKDGKQNFTCADVKVFGVDLEEYYQYKDTLYLAFTHLSGQYKRIAVFIGCTSKDDFLNPVITMKNTPNSCGSVNNPEVSSIQTTKMSSKHPLVPTDEVMWRKGYCVDTSIAKTVYAVYGKKGEVLKVTESITPIETPNVIGRKLYGISPDGVRVCCDDLTDSINMSEELPTIHTLLCGGGKIITVTDTAIYFLNPKTLSVLKITKNQESTLVELSENGCSIKCLERSVVKVLEQRRVSVGDVDKIRLALSINMMLMFAEVSDETVEIVLDIHVPGLPKEVCTVSTQVGFLVSASVFSETQNFYRENLFYYRHDGRLVGLLPFLGPGPRSFCVEYLKGQGNVTDTGHGDKGWYVFMRDGHEGIIGVRLP